MSQEPFDLQAYLTAGAEKIVKDAIKATFSNPKESAFMAKFALAARQADKKREKAEKEGEHIPTYLIASITSACNLHCAGCYSRCSDATVDAEPVDQLSADEWLRIFKEAEDLGISFIILAGGEPLMRRDVIEAAATRPGILFPIFTNGVYIDEKYFKLFDKNRNLIPVMSIEGGREKTDFRRGKGIYDLVSHNMDELRKRGMIFGCSITVTKENLEEVVSEAFVKELSDKGCKVLIYVEYVPTDEETADLAPDDRERAILAEGIARLRAAHDEIVFVSFPGDEKESGGCVAAGRGFFHINSHGGAEPCPFSPFSDTNIRNTSLKEALHSDLFTALRSGGILTEDHIGGCVLYEKRQEVEALLKK